jgi:hypothetical protein
MKKKEESEKQERKKEVVCMAVATVTRHCPQASGSLCHSEFQTPKFTYLPFVLPFKV